jgi:alkylation response protein AidB-like acyl-CoA dehydrogenase
MTFELSPKTEAGAHLVALAEAVADEIAPRAAAHDRDASFPFESFDAVKRSGYFSAPSTTCWSLRRGSRVATRR